MVKVKEDMTGWKMWEHGVPDSRLTVIERAEDNVLSNGKKQVRYLCECNCTEHNRTVVLAAHLKNGRTLSCGCVQKEKAGRAKFIDMTGWVMSEHGVPDSKLTVIKRVEDHVTPKGVHYSKWLCECSCEEHNQIVAYGSHLKNGRNKDCGCSRKNKKAKEQKKNNENTKKKSLPYGWKRLRIIWRNMRRRCSVTTCDVYDRYGGRGIFVCKEWDNSFETFYNWAINNGYNDSLTIDRKDNDKGYCPENCKWSTYKEQGNNRRSCHYITYNGETHTIKEWGEINHINPGTIRTRIHAGWNEIKAITVQN